MNLTSLSGRQINPKEPKAEDLDIRDIAHALNNICRFSGQFMTHYSVAAHSLAVSHLIERDGGTPLECLTGLLHDAAEAYLQDLPTPVKIHCHDYRALEVNFNKELAKRFGTLYPFPMIVDHADKTALNLEKGYQTDRKPLGLVYAGRDCDREFLRRFVELGGLVAMKKATIERLNEKYAQEEAESLDIVVEQKNLGPLDAIGLVDAEMGKISFAQPEAICGKKPKKKKRKKKNER